jgi:hypothetical protein
VPASATRLPDAPPRAGAAEATPDAADLGGPAGAQATRSPQRDGGSPRTAAQRAAVLAEPDSPIEQALAELLAATAAPAPSTLDPLLLNSLTAGHGTRGDGGRTADPAGLDDSSPWGRLSSGVVQAETAAAVLGAGFVWWSLRAAGLLATVLASAPVWRHLDPIPILGGDDREGGDGPAPADDDEAARDEAASQELLEPVRRTTV